MIRRKLLSYPLRESPPPSRVLFYCTFVEIQVVTAKERAEEHMGAEACVWLSTFRYVMCKMLELFYHRPPLDEYLCVAKTLIPLIPDTRYAQSHS